MMDNKNSVVPKIEGDGKGFADDKENKIALFGGNGLKNMKKKGTGVKGETQDSI